jgi:hypothetical protein
VRRGRGGIRSEGAAGLVAAGYRHRISRALDPQLHTHVVCANLARGSDGRWTALDGRPLYEFARTAGFLYQAHLRAEVRDRLGLEWGGVVKGAAELARVSEGVLQHFSTRSQQIREAIDADGREPGTWAARDSFALRTRDRKHYGREQDTHTWREEVRARAGEHGLDRVAVAELLAEGRERLRLGEPTATGGADEHALADRLAGAQGLTENANTFAGRDVLREFAGAAGQGALVDDVRLQGARFAARGDVLETVAGGLTTQNLVAAERRLIAAAVERAREGTGIVDDATLQRGLSALDRPLTDEQAQALHGVTGSGNGVDVIEALAGTGKTFTAGALRRVYEDAGWRVVGVAPTARAVRELAEEAGFAAWTLDRAFADLERGDRLPDRTVVVLDEAGMASTRKTERLLEAARASRAKVVAIGDSGQLPSVQAGGWLREVGDLVGAHRLTLGMRQRDAAERQALATLHDGRSEAYLKWADGHDRVVAHTDDGAIRAAIEDWQQATDAHAGGQTVLIARDNATRSTLNDLARAHVRASGVLGDDVAYGPLTLAVGDRIICRRKDRSADVDNGTRGSVLETGPAGVVVQTDAGTLRRLPADYVAEHVEHAYCLTGHGMQGGTVEHAIVVAAPRDLTRGWSYTALSRARGQTRLHVDGQHILSAVQAERAELAPHDARERPTHAGVLARTAERMKVRDDEDLAVTQLPAHLAPGRADDAELHAAAGTAGLERRAEHAEPANQASPQRDELRVICAELADLAAQRAKLPLRALRALDTVDRELVRVRGQRDEAAVVLERLPTPQRGLLGRRTKDVHAVERARLAAAVECADRHLTALGAEREELASARANALEVRAERDGIDRRVAGLDREAHILIDELVERAVAQPPEWAREVLGERPTDRRDADRWDGALRVLERFRVEHLLADNSVGIGPEPVDACQPR